MAEVVHRCPIGDAALTPCCQRSPFDLPLDDRMTAKDHLVTCTPWGNPDATPLRGISRTWPVSAGGELCQNPGCDRTTAPGAQWCCYACCLALSYDYQVPAVGNLSHTDRCQHRQAVVSVPHNL